VVGLTSASNMGFTEGLGVYDRVVAYEDVASLGGAFRAALRTASVSPA